MSASITVAGVVREMGGLKESQAAFRKHHKEIGDALLNISGIGTVTGEAVDKDDPRMPYVHQPFPKMIYHPEHGELVVHNQAELDEALRQRYRLEPYVKPQIAVADPKTEKLELERKLTVKDGEIATLHDTQRKLMERLEALEAKANAKPIKN